MILDHLFLETEREKKMIILLNVLYIIMLL